MDELTEARFKAEGYPPMPEAEGRAAVPSPESVPLASDANPNHREDFRVLLTAAVKKNELRD